MRYSASAAMHALALILSSAQEWYRRVPLQSSVQTELTQVYSSMAGTPCSRKFSYICDRPNDLFATTFSICAATGWSVLKLLQISADYRLCKLRV
jgi:hypothetical protein